MPTTANPLSANASVSAQQTASRDVDSLVAPAPNIHYDFMDTVGADWFLGADFMDRSISALVDSGNSGKGRRLLTARRCLHHFYLLWMAFPNNEGTSKVGSTPAPFRRDRRPPAVAGAPRCSLFCLRARAPSAPRRHPHVSGDMIATNPRSGTVSVCHPRASWKLNDF